MNLKNWVVILCCRNHRVIRELETVLNEGIPSPYMCGVRPTFYQLPDTELDQRSFGLRTYGIGIKGFHIRDPD